jgi:hypothetical protein
MDLQAAKLELVKLILNINNKSTIEKLFEVLKPENRDFWEELSNAEKAEIELGISQLNDGKRESLENVLANIE